MRSAARLLVVLLLGVAIFGAVAYVVLLRTTHEWFESDLIMRSRLAVVSARRSLIQNWRTDPLRLERVLTDITRDERITGVAACASDRRIIAATKGYPLAVSCEMAFERAAFSTETLSKGVHFTAVPLDDAGERLGAIILVHDLSYLGKREAVSRNLLLAGLLAFALGGAALTLSALRLSRRGWIRELRRALAGGGTRDFQPLVRDVRSLAERLVREREFDTVGGRWSAERLRATLRQHLDGERIVIAANREPYIHETSDDGIRILHPASGLVTALEPVARACSGVWVAHGSGSGDRETVDSHDRVRVPPGEESYVLRRVWLDEAEENGYYYGFSNEGLWPLCHVAHTRPEFRAEDWEHYVAANRKFALAVVEEASSDDPIVLVQDYHLALAPKMIRERLPRATIITFWHIPWPNAERVGICPWREELISGLLGSSIVGFHTQQHCNNFIDSVDAFMESRIDREERAIVQGGRKTLIRPYPISIEWPVHWLTSVPPVGEARALVREELGLASDALIGVGVDRLDYTKGIEERLNAVEQLLSRYPEFRGKFTFVQLAAPSRTKIQKYRELNERVEALAEAVNAKWGTADYRPVVLLRSHHEPAAVFRYCRAAELCYVSCLHDGMNLVAKEFVAARDDEQGVLVLSQFTGAARDLTEALIVNPYDLRQASDALAAALRMPSEEQRERMRSMRRVVSEFNVYRWAGRMLTDAAELRRKERIAGRFGSAGWLRRAGEG